MANNDGGPIDDVFNRKISRRRALSTGGKVGVAVVATAVVAGAGGYFIGTSKAPSQGGSTTTITNTYTTTVTGAGSTGATGTSSSSTSAGGSTASSTATSSTTINTITGVASNISVPNANPSAIYAPLVVSVENPASNISGELNFYFPLRNEWQCDVGTPGNMAYATAQAVAKAYPNLKVTYFNPGSVGTPLVDAMQAGQTGTWDFSNWGSPSYLPLGYCGSMQDYWNDWTQEDRDAFDPNDIASCTYNGELSMLPCNANWETAWCRIDVLAQAGYGTVNTSNYQYGESYTGTTPTGLNYSEFLTMCQKVTQPSKEFYAFYPPIAPGNSVVNLSPDAMLQANGCRLWLGDVSSCTITMEQAPNYNRALDTFQMYTNAIAMGVVTPGFQSITHAETRTAEQTGTFAFQFGQDPGLWSGELSTPITSPAATTYPGLTLGYAWNVCACPTDNDYPIPWATKSEAYLWLTSGSKNPDAAWEWIKTYNGQAAQYGEGLGGAGPVRSDVIPLINELNAPLLSQWLSFGAPAQWVDIPLLASPYSSILGMGETTSWADYWAGSQTAEQAISTFVTNVGAQLQAANVGPYTATSTSTQTSGSFT